MLRGILVLGGRVQTGRVSGGGSEAKGLDVKRMCLILLSEVEVFKQGYGRI